MNAHICRAMAVLAIWGVASLTGRTAMAQNTLRYEDVRDRNFYLSGNNIAGMRCDSVSIATAVLEGGYRGGENRLMHEAPDAWHLRAGAATIMHLRRVSMFGGFQFRQDMGYGMCGSMMLHPELSPIGVSEYTPGNKSLQTYAFTGGASMDLTRDWRLGIRLDYQSSNYAKLKDLRYTDYAMDLDFRIGTQYLAGNGLTVGIAAALALNGETINAEQIGESNTSYYAFLNKGAWWGTNQVWTGGGLHLSESGISGLPIMDMGAGASAQLSWKGLYAEIAYLRTSGKVGEKDAIWFRFPANTVSADIAWRWRSNGAVIHTLRGHASWKTRDLHETVLDKVTEGGVTIRHEYGSNRIQRSSDATLGISWKAAKEGLFIARVGLDYANNALTTTIQYPLAGFQRLQKFGAQASLTWFLPLGWSIDAALCGGAGLLTEENWKADTTVESTTELYRSISEYENWKFQNTNPYFGVNFAPRYTFPLNIYLSPFAGCEWRIAPLKDKQYRVAAGLTLGYTF